MRPRMLWKLRKIWIRAAARAISVKHFTRFLGSVAMAAASRPTVGELLEVHDDIVQLGALYDAWVEAWYWADGNPADPVALEDLRVAGDAV